VSTFSSTNFALFLSKSLRADCQDFKAINPYLQLGKTPILRRDANYTSGQGFLPTILWCWQRKPWPPGYAPNGLRNAAQIGLAPDTPNGPSFMATMPMATDVMRYWPRPYTRAKSRGDWLIWRSSRGERYISQAGHENPGIALLAGFAHVISLEYKPDSGNWFD
jgi:hypothetical protein